MNTPFGSRNFPFAPPQMYPSPQEEEERRRIHAKKMALAQTQPAPVLEPIQPVKLAQQSDPWGEGSTCIGLKILCGVMGLIVVVLVIVLIIKLVHHKGQGGLGQTSQASPGNSQLPMSLQGGGFDFANESLMSTS